jgi:hypothetical protein
MRGVRLTDEERVVADAKMADQSKAWRETNRERVRDMDKARYHADPEKSQARARDWQRRNRNRRRAAAHGLSLTEYDMLVSKQGNRCAICLQPETSVDQRQGLVRALAIDHDHDTGEVRGLLCSRCNLAIGLLQDDSDLIAAAAAYVASNRKLRVIS